MAKLGRLTVSVVGLGCNNFGRPGPGLDADGAARVVAAALDEGITYFDTADRYGEGRSERYLGRALGSKRGDVVVATKFGIPVPGVEGSGGARPDYVFRAVERSLRELDTDWIDLYQLHRPDPSTPIADTLGALSQLVEQGKVREIGCSNFSAQQMREAAAIGSAVRFIANQVEYSIVNREPERTGVTAAADDCAMALLPYRPLAKGLLTGKHQRGVRPSDGLLAADRYQRFLTEENWKLVDALRDFAAARDLKVPQVALSWLLSRPNVPSVIPGARTPEQVRSNAAAGHLTLAADDVAALDQLLPAASASSG